jgi:hypothetical protein
MSIPYYTFFFIFPKLVEKFHYTTAGIAAMNFFCHCLRKTNSWYAIHGYIITQSKASRNPSDDGGMHRGG